MEEALPLLRAEGLLPHGIVGESAFRKQLEKVDKFICQLDAEPGSGSLDPVPVDLQAGPIRLVGWLSNLQPEGFLAHRCAHLNPSFIIETVIKHLLVNAEVPQGVLPETRVLTLEAKACLQSMPSSEALQQLAQLGEFYWQGLQYPLFFPPRSALSFARNWAKTRDQSKAFKEGKKIWEYSQYNKRSGEELDPYFSLAFGHTEDPLMEHGENMRELAEILYIPVMEKL